MISACETDAGHGRIETRTASLSGDIAWLQDSHAWPGLKAIGKVTATREIEGKTRTQTRYDLLSQAFDPTCFNAIVRSHWRIECPTGTRSVNGLHWVLDVIMDEDNARNRKDHGPENLALLRRLAVNFAKLEPSKGSMRGKLKRAAGDTPFLFDLLTQFAPPQMR
jgi:predicted transposase YbfD/YdcC